MERWFWLAISAILLWGLGSFLGKLGLAKDTPYRVYFFEGVGTLTVFTFFAFYKRGEVFADFSFNPYALIMGLCWGVGTILFIAALKSEKLSVIGPLAAIYPAFTVILSVLFLQERLEFREIVGVMFTVISLVLLSK